MRGRTLPCEPHPLSGWCYVHDHDPKAGRVSSCAGCGNDLDGDNLCMVSACQMEDEPGWCSEHSIFLCHDESHDQSGRPPSPEPDVLRALEFLNAVYHHPAVQDTDAQRWARMAAEALRPGWRSPTMAPARGLSQEGVDGSPGDGAPSPA